MRAFNRLNKRMGSTPEKTTMYDVNPQTPPSQQASSVEVVMNKPSTPTSVSTSTSTTSSGGIGGGGGDSPDQAKQQQQSQAPASLERFWNVAKHHVTTLNWVEYMGEACVSATYLNPCSLRTNDLRNQPGEDTASSSSSAAAASSVPTLGISPMRPPSDDVAMAKQRAAESTQAAAPSYRRKVDSENNNNNSNNNENNNNNNSSNNNDNTNTNNNNNMSFENATVALSRHYHEDIEVLPNHKVQVRLPPLHGTSQENINSTTKKRRQAPVVTLEVPTPDAMTDLERSISELTMRSSYAATSESLNKLPDNRRMAYYAVGKHHQHNSRGGNRRCYFTGKLILGNMPFYAGSVQQGLRTLVVFCLPSALGLPGQDALKSKQAARSGNFLSAIMNGSTGSVRSNQSPPVLTPPSLAAREASRGSSKNSRLLPRRNKALSSNQSIASKSLAMSRLSSLDDLSLSIDGDLDPNWGLDRDFLLKVLPDASSELVKQMDQMYPEQFETLPIQVRDPKVWKLYVKFCFFSGLPIAEGEMHYKVRDDIAEQVYGEEIVLSHEVMEAVNGESAEILTLPNMKAFRYLRKHYTQQCSKLDERVFRRNAWERVAPEV